jgi:hypothetical protein
VCTGWVDLAEFGVGERLTGGAGAAWAAERRRVRAAVAGKWARVEWAAW